MSNSLEAQKAEANGDEIIVPFGDHVYTVPGPLDWPFETLDLLGDGKVSKAVAGLLGDEQLETFRSTKPTVRDAVALMESIAAASGSGELGN
ncbi:hypothetical protein ACFWY5_29870 [Nonomuraea sp. NPDC059007]|uniref:hypothetical protein n=1 Tax=Nonomuraea sp. NPDC059007 TaxID=3346692 RepID=UPI003675343E